MLKLRTKAKIRLTSKSVLLILNWKLLDRRKAITYGDKTKAAKSWKESLGAP